MSDLYCIKPGYQSRATAPAPSESSPTEAGKSSQPPHIYPLAVYLAQHYDCTQLIDIRYGSEHELTTLDPECELTVIEWDLNQPKKPQLDTETLRHAIIVCANVIERLPHPDELLDQLHTWLDDAPVALLTTPDRNLLHGPDDMGPPRNAHHIREWNRPEFAQFLDSHNLRAEFLGLTVSDDHTQDKYTTLAVLANNHRPPIETAPPEFTVAAIVTIYNENDIILPMIDHLQAQGVGVYVMDNWSTDGTYELVQARLGQGVIGVERFPLQKEEGEHIFSLREQLVRKEAIAHELDANWIIHYDADEIRESPWPGVSLRDALYYLDRCGFNAVNHTMIDFFPSDDRFQPGCDPHETMHYFEFGKYPGYFYRINTWKHTGQRMSSLWESGGHHVEFEGRRLSPYKFLLRHYPFRSREQTVRKIRERRKGSNRLERTVLGWHHMYDRFSSANDDQLFEEVCTTSQAERIWFDPATFYDHYLVERISGVGLERWQPRNWTRHVPPFAIPFFRFGKRILDRIWK